MQTGLLWRHHAHLVSVALTLSSLFVVGSSASAATQTFAPIADTEINADRPTINFGKSSGIGVDASPERIGLLRFDITVPAGESVTRATLRLFSASQHATSYYVHPVVSTTWGETTTTYANAPAIEQQGIASGPHPGNAYVPVDVTALVKGPGAISFALKRTSSVAIPYNSREAATNRPELVIESQLISDTTNPIVFVTAPASGSTVSGNSVTVSADATDNVAVAGVQFYVDDAALGPEDTSAPYSTPWDSTSASEGLHTLSAVARDAAGNLASSEIPVTVARSSKSTFTSVADTEINADRPTMNFGRASGIGVDASPERIGLLRFVVSIPSDETVTKATLRLFSAAQHATSYFVHPVASTTWGETTTTYANAPLIGEQGIASGPHPGNAYVEVDVTGLINGPGAISLAVKRTSSVAIPYNSREAATNRPELVIERSATGNSTLVFAVGDGADGSAVSLALAQYIAAAHPDRFFYLGDVYETGTAADFATKYEPLYGALASVTDPVMGNHEYPNRAVGYFPYWAGKRGWTEEAAAHRAYVDPASGWQIIAYSSESDPVTEGAWVAEQIAKHGGTCRIAMAHRGRHVVTDTSDGDNPDQEPVWSQIIGNTAINLLGHDHIYGRLAALNGVHVIVSGAGGHGLRQLGVQHHTVEAARTGTATATRLILRRGAADFYQEDKEGIVYDSGTIPCTPAT